MENKGTYITAEDIELLKDLINRKNKGLMVDSRVVVELYNRIMGKPAKPTTCRGCLVGYISTMERKWGNIERAIEKAKEASEAVKTEEVKNDTSEEKEEPTVAENKPKTKGVSKKKK